MVATPAVLRRRRSTQFMVFPSTYGYEDDELAFRMKERFGTPVLFRPEAVAEHDHRMEPGAYLKREYKLGYAAWGFARTARECALAMFGRSIASRSEVEYSRQFVERERGAAARLEESFLRLVELPANAASGAGETLHVRLLYDQHLLLKRWHWRRGLLAASDASETALEVSDQASV